MSYQTILIKKTPYPVVSATRMGAKGMSFTLANNDLTNTLWAGTSPTVSPGDSDSIAIPPLGSIPVPGDIDTYVVSSQAAGVQALLMPGLGGWTAAPSQIQASLNALGLAKDTTVAGTTTAVNNLPASGLAKDTTVTGVTTAVGNVPSGISTTGVPLLGNSNVLENQQSQVLAAAGNTSYTVSVNQIGYEIAFQLNMSGSATVPFVGVTMQWIDTASGQIVEQEQWYLAVGSAANKAYIGTGPSQGNQLKITLTNYDPSFTVAYNFTLSQTSRLYVLADWQCTDNVSVPTFTNPDMDLQAGIVADSNIAVTSATNIARLMPLYYGTVEVFINNSAPSTLTSVAYALHATGDRHGGAVLTNDLIHGAGFGGNANTGPFRISLPRCPCTFTIIGNTGSGNALISVRTVPR